MLRLLVGSSLATAAAFSVGGAPARGVARAAVSMASLHDFAATALDGTEVAMSGFQGKPVLILNVASL